MKPTEFVKVNSQFWGDHLRSVSEHLPTSHSRELPGPLLYPRTMVLTETPDWNILELVGVSREYRSLEVRRQKAAGIDEYFGTTGSAAPVANLPGENFFRDATIATERARKALKKSFPGTEGLIGNEMVGTGDAGDGKLLGFAPGNYTAFERVLLASSAGSSVRIHWTFLTIAIHRSEPADKYRDFLQNLVNSAAHLDPVGTFAVPRGELDQVLKAAPFESTYQHALAKATVGEFLQQHEDILLSAFDATQLISRPVLEGSEQNPDFILERADGSHIVGDVTLPLLEIAKGGKKVHRSVTVREGAARLAEYGKYFENVENQALVKSKYGVEITDPRKLLVIGSQDTLDTVKDAVEIVDYETIIRLHLAAKSWRPAKPADSGISSVAILDK